MLHVSIFFSKINAKKKMLMPEFSPFPVGTSANRFHNC